MAGHGGVDTSSVGVTPLKPASFLPDPPPPLHQNKEQKEDIFTRRQTRLGNDSED